MMQLRVFPLVILRLLREMSAFVSPVNERNQDVSVGTRIASSDNGLWFIATCEASLPIAAAAEAITDSIRATVQFPTNS